jgi:hypothetical protein
VAVIIMNRFVIKPVLAPPTKQINSSEILVPATSNPPEHQHNWQMGQACPAPEINTEFNSNSELEVRG